MPLDSIGKVFVITSELESRLGLFQEYPEFLEARLYQASDSGYYLEILERKDSSQVRTRVPKTAEEVVDLRHRVSLAISQRAPESLYNHEGRAGLIVNSAILSAGFYGWAIPVASKMDGTASVTTYFFVTAAGILGPALGTDRMDITRATAMMDFYGGSRGIAHGIAVYYALDPKEDHERAPYGWAVVTSLVERAALNAWATKSGMTAGKAAVIGVGGDFGIGLSAALASGYGLWNREHQHETGMMILAGSTAGMVAGTQLADHGHYTRGDGYVLRGIGIVGCALPAAICDVADQDGQTAATMAAAGSLVGLGIGHRLLRDVDFSSSQGFTVLFAEFGFAALAMTPVLASAVDNSGPYSLAAALSGTAGFALGYAITSKSARTIHQSTELDFEFNPLPLVTETRDSMDPLRDHRAKQAFVLTYRF
ncbi:MAG: hypothetical protein IPG71_10340 [bacterium]|nr:hypothetical protein [bacterium]